MLDLNKCFCSDLPRNKVEQMGKEFRGMGTADIVFTGIVYMFYYILQRCLELWAGTFKICR